MRNFNTVRQRVVLGAVLLFGGGLAVAGSGCGSGETTNQEKNPRLLTFDYLGGGSKVIQVYPGADNTPEDKDDIGTYFDGDQVLAECWTTGRQVPSHPELGELFRRSNKWFRIDAEPTQYATAVYVEDPQKLLKQLPECEE